jgi:putative ABC transport system permease protein
LWLPQESWVILASLGLGIVAALIPAIQAYRTDLARILANA